jgi:hypothetical protein
VTYSLIVLAATWASGQSYPVPVVPATSVPAPATSATTPNVTSVPVSTAATPVYQSPSAPVPARRRGFLGRVRGVLPWNWGKSSSFESAPRTVAQPSPTVISQPVTTPVFAKPRVTTDEPPLATESRK